MESAAPFGHRPRAPDAFPLVVTFVEPLVPAQVSFRPPALPVRSLVAPRDDEGTDPILAFAAQQPVAEGELEIHPVASRQQWLQEETPPRPGREPAVLLTRDIGGWHG